MSRNARILIVDDSAVVRGLLSRLIAEQPGMEVAGTAPDGRVAVEKMRRLKPDLLVLDLEMPVMNGLEALAEIRKTDEETPIVIFSALSERGARATIQALELGASDYAAKPRGFQSMSTALAQVKEELVSKITALLPRNRPSWHGAVAPEALHPRKRRVAIAKPQAVVVGSSTGGPHALESVLTGLRQPLAVPMFITQHMPPTFTRVLAERLETKCASTVLEGADGMVAEPGHCYIAPGGFHMALGRRGANVVLSIVDSPPVNSCKPSVEPMFASAAEIYGRRLVAVMLTGMGSDGLDGSRTISDLGSPVVVQDEATSVVWGMPGAVAKAGLASEILPLAEIGPRLMVLAGAGRRAPVSGRQTI